MKQIHHQVFQYLPQLVVDHHVVGLHVPVHDPHTVTVVQSLKPQTDTQHHHLDHRPTYQNSNKKTTSTPVY